MKNPILTILLLFFCFFTINSFGQNANRKRFSQTAISLENCFYRIPKTERDPNLYVKSLFYRRDLPHWRKWLCRVDLGGVWYNNGVYLENHVLFGRPVKKVDVLGGISLRCGNLPKEFLTDDAIFLNPELLLAIRAHPFFKKLTVEARLNLAFIDYYDTPTTYEENIKVPGFGFSLGYIFQKHPK